MITTFETNLTIEKCSTRLKELPNKNDVKRRKTPPSVVPIGCDFEESNNRFFLCSQRNSVYPLYYTIDLDNKASRTEVRSKSPSLPFVYVIISAFWLFFVFVTSRDEHTGHFLPLNDILPVITFFSAGLAVIAYGIVSEYKQNIRVTTDFICTLLETIECSENLCNIEQSKKYSFWTRMSPEQCNDILKKSIDFRPTYWIQYLVFNNLVAKHERKPFLGDIYRHSFCVELRGTSIDYGFYFGGLQFCGTLTAEKTGTRIAGNFAVHQPYIVIIIMMMLFFAIGGLIASIIMWNSSPLMFTAWSLIIPTIFCVSAKGSQSGTLQSLIRLLDAESIDINKEYKPKNWLEKVLN